MDPDYFNTIEKAGVSEFKDRGSRFLAYAFPIITLPDFKTELKNIKNEHPKASHHCFAYRLGTNGNNYRSSDDGEPSGTAGRPILGQIDNKRLTNMAIVVVRYFGGTLLGVPGLIHAYKTAAGLVLQTIPHVRKAVEIPYRLQFDYTLMNDVMRIVKKFNCTIIKQEIQLFCLMEIGIPATNLELCLSLLKDLAGLVMVDKLTS